MPIAGSRFSSPRNPAVQELDNDILRDGTLRAGCRRIGWLPCAFIFCTWPLGAGIPTNWQVPRPPTNCTCNRQDCKNEAIYHFQDGFFEITPSHGDHDTGTNICEVLWAMMGCACDRCRDFSYFDQVLLVSQDYCGCSTLDVQCAEVVGSPWQIPSGGKCTPVCPHGTYASQDSLTCTRGRFLPASYSCLSALPAMRPAYAHFLDAAAEAGYVAGRFQIQLGNDILAAGAVGADVYFGNSSRAGSLKAASWPVLALNESHVRWLPRQAVPWAATHLWVFPTTSAERGPQALPIPIRDMEVSPKQPQVGDDVEVRIRDGGSQLEGSLMRLAPGSNCRAPVHEAARQWRLRAKHTTTTYYWHLQEVHFYSDTACTHELLGEVLQSANGQKSLDKRDQHWYGAPILDMPAKNAVYKYNASNHWTNQVFNVTDKCWHGRMDGDGLFWIGLNLSSPSEAACVRLEHCEEFWPAHTAMSHHHLVVERYANGGWESVDGFEAEGIPGMYDRNLTFRRHPGQAMLRPFQEATIDMVSSATFRPVTSGHYTVCSCPPGAGECRDDAEFAEAVATVAVSGIAKGISAGSGSRLSSDIPLNANIRLRLQGVALGKHDRLGISSDQCGSTTTSLPGLDIAGRVTELNETGVLTWYVSTAIPEPMSLEVCHWVNSCDDLEELEVRQACKHEQRSQARPLSMQLDIRECRHPCQSCLGELDICSACEAGLMAFEGKCFNCSRPVLDVLASSSSLRQADGLLQMDAVEPLPAIATSDSLATEVGLRSPAHVAALSPTQLLIADRLSNAILRLDLDADEANDRLRLACPQCGSPHLKAPRSVRVAPSGLFWVVVDTGNNRIIKVDAHTLQATIVAGSGPTVLFEDLPYFHFSFLAETPIKHTVTSSGDGGLAVVARLCHPTDAAIHRGEEELLILESKCEDWQLPSVRMVDGRGRISTAVRLSEMCEPGSIDWRPGAHDSIVVACGGSGLEAYSRDASGRWLADTGFVSSAALGYSLISVARWGPDATLLLAASFDNRTMVVERIIANNETRVTSVQRVAGGGTTSLRGLQLGGTWRGPWSDEASLLSVAGLAVGSDGVTYVTDSQTAVLLRVRPPCGINVAGSGSGDGYWDREVDGTLLSRPGCSSCPAGQYNDGSAELQDRCKWCDVAAFETTGNVCKGAVQCACLPGFHRNLTSGSCDPCSPGMVCRGYAFVELDTNEVKSNVSAGCYDAMTVDWPMESCGGHRVSYDLASIDGEGQPLRAPGYIRAISADVCDCCYGRYWNPRNKECSPCPVGLWCSGELASPGAIIRVKDGYTARDIDRVYMCAHPSHCQWSTHDQRQHASHRIPCNTAFVREASECDQEHCSGVQIGGALGQCPPGRKGLACGQCEDNGYTPTMGAACRSCAGMTQRFCIALAATVGCPLLLYFLFINLRPARLHALGGMFSLIGITLVFAAHLKALHGRTLIQWWSLGTVNFLEAADWAMWYLAPVNLGCLTEDLSLLSFLQWGAPWVPIVTLFIFWLVTLAVPCCWMEKAFVFDSAVAHNVLGMLYAMLVAPITAAPMSFFQCYEHPTRSSRNSWLAQRWSMWSHPDTECFRTEWLEASSVALCGLVLPILWIIVQIHISSFGPLAYMQATDESRKLYRHHHLCIRYRTGQHYWDLLTAFRVLALELIIAFPMGLLWQAYILFAINMMTLGLLVAYRPHCQLLTNVYEGVCLVAIMTTISYGLSLPLRDGSVVVSSAAGPLTIIMVICAFTFAGGVCLIALKDMLFATRATEKEEERATAFAAMLQDLSNRVAKGHQVRINAVVESMDQRSLHDAEASLHGLQQFFQPVEDRQGALKLSDIRWTRLHAFKWRTSEIEEDIRRHHDTDVSNSLIRDRRKSRSAMATLRSKGSSKSSRFRRSTSASSQTSSWSMASWPSIPDDASTVEEALVHPATNSASLRLTDGGERTRSSSPQDNHLRNSSSTKSSDSISRVHARARSPARSQTSLRMDTMNYDNLTRGGSNVSLGSYPSLRKQHTTESLLSSLSQPGDAEHPAQFWRERPDSPQIEPSRRGDEALSIRVSDLRSSLGGASSAGENEKGDRDRDVNDTDSPPASPASLQADCLPTIRSERETALGSRWEVKDVDTGDEYGLPRESLPRSPPGHQPAQPAAAIRAAQRAQSQAMLRARRAAALSPEQVDVSVGTEVGAAVASRTRSRSAEAARNTAMRKDSFKAGQCSYV